MTTIKLTDAQNSALDCAGAQFVLDEADRALADAYNPGRGTLEFDEADRDAIVSSIIELANGEDEVAENTNEDPDRRRASRGARSALTNLVGKL